MTLESRVARLETSHQRGLTYVCPVPPGASPEQVDALLKAYLKAHPEADRECVILPEIIEKQA